MLFVRFIELCIIVMLVYFVVFRFLIPILGNRKTGLKSKREAYLERELKEFNQKQYEDELIKQKGEQNADNSK